MTLIDPTPEQELASAYLDDQVTAAERARVEASSELQALVASMREVKTLVAAVPPAGAGVREAAIATALAEFQTVGSGSPAVSLPVVSLASRRRWPNRVLSAAAAVVLLGVVGITVLQSRGDNKSDSAAGEPKFEANRSADTDAVGAGLPETADDQVFTAMESPLVIDDPAQLRLLPVPSPPTADTTADTDSSTAVAAGAQRESYNVDALACMSDDQEFLADIYYQGTLAIAVRDTVTGVTEAIDSDCTVLASVSP